MRSRLPWLIAGAIAILAVVSVGFIAGRNSNTSAAQPSATAPVVSAVGLAPAASATPAEVPSSSPPAAAPAVAPEPSAEGTARWLKPDPGTRRTPAASAAPAKTQEPVAPPPTEPARPRPGALDDRY